MWDDEKFESAAAADGSSLHVGSKFERAMTALTTQVEQLECTVEALAKTHAQLLSPPEQPTADGMKRLGEVEPPAQGSPVVDHIGMLRDRLTVVRRGIQRFIEQSDFAA